MNDSNKNLENLSIKGEEKQKEAKRQYGREHCVSIIEEQKEAARQYKREWRARKKAERMKNQDG